MAGRTVCITEARWENISKMWYSLVDNVYQALENHYEDNYL